MVSSGPSELLLVSFDSTTGWNSAGRELAASIERAGVAVRRVGTGPPRAVRTFMLTDFVQARAARRVAAQAVAGHPPDAIIYCSITAALLWPMPGAIWLDSLAAENRPGRHGLWQRRIERRRLAEAPLVLTMAEDSLRSLPDVDWPGSVTVPVAVEASGPINAPRDIDVLAYAGDPRKRRLGFILEQWDLARREGETLVVTGFAQASAPPGVRFTGRLDPAEYRALVRRARVFVAAPQREDFGIAALEALADGCQLVTTPAPGPYPALALARELDPRLVSSELAPALRSALDDPRPGYARRARELVAPFSRAAVDEVVVKRVLPRLLPRWAPE
ncbi:MAG: glycosyltransferase [Actinomycetota bacterium]|nr:glycosyltransferase [Actinomycetota bacterium]